MSTHALSGSHAPLILDGDVWEGLERLAETAGRSGSDLAVSVLREFVRANEGQLAAIDAGIAEADRGEVSDFADVKVEIQEKLAALAAKR